MFRHIRKQYCSNKYIVDEDKYGIVKNKIYFEKGEKRHIKHTKNVHA